MHKPYSAFPLLFTWINAVHKYKNKITRENDRQLPALWKMYTRNSFKIQKKRHNDYDLWMKHQRKLFQGYSNLECMTWYNLKLEYSEPILIKFHIFFAN